MNERPALLGLVYPAIDGTLFGATGEATFPSMHHGVDAQTPPTFILQTHEDYVVSPKHQLTFYIAMLEAERPAEIHISAVGGHGMRLALRDPDLGRWPTLLLAWLQRHGLLTGAPRASIAGSVTEGGKPLYWNWISLRPTGHMGWSHPSAEAYIGWRPEGEFKIDASHGPTPCEYTVDIHRAGQDFCAPHERAVLDG